MVDDYGHNIFESIKITLVRTPLGLWPRCSLADAAPCFWVQVCDDCLKTGMQAIHTLPPVGSIPNQVPTPVPLADNRLRALPCLQTTPKSAPPP